jgi:hypothetical protein
MFVFACPIIAKSQYWLFALKYGTNIRIGPQISVFALNVDLYNDVRNLFVKSTQDVDI